MELTIAPRDILQIDDAKICFRNFKGEKSMYNDEGKRNFSVIIPNAEIAEELQNNTNRYGVGWNVKIKAPNSPDEAVFMHLPVAVSFTDRSQPGVYLISGKSRVKLNEETIYMLDDIDIESVSLDIRPFDGESKFGPFRKAYLSSIYVTQAVDRLAARFAETDEEEY